MKLTVFSCIYTAILSGGVHAAKCLDLRTDLASDIYKHAVTYGSNTKQMQLTYSALNDHKDLYDSVIITYL